MTALLALLAVTASSFAADEPDLTFTDFSAVYDPMDDEITATAKVTNIGDAWSSSFYVDFFSSSDWSTCADLGWVFQAHSGLAPGQSADITVVLDGALGDEQRVYYFVDLDDFSLESNEKNNEGITDFLFADPGEPVVVHANLWKSNPACLRNLIQLNLGMDINAAADVFYSKLRIL